MKNNKLLASLLLLTCCYSSQLQANYCAETFNNSNKEENDMQMAISCVLSLQTPTPVGTVIFSKLDPATFEEHYGARWVLADGRAVSTNTKYYKITGEDKTPDLRGVFIRGVNAGRNDGRGDEVKNRAAGDYQSSSTKLPETDFLIGREGPHTHGDPTWNGLSGPYELATTHRGPGGRDFGAQSARTTADGGHSHTISGGDKETRPKNVAMFTYIRIN